MRRRPNTTLMGEPTGSAAGVFCGGGFSTSPLPHSGFRVELPYMERHVALTDPDTDPHLPVMPDHWIDIHQADLMEGRDPVLEKVYELIQGFSEQGFSATPRKAYVAIPTKMVNSPFASLTSATPADAITTVNSYELSSRFLRTNNRICNHRQTRHCSFANCLVF